MRKQAERLSNLPDLTQLVGGRAVSEGKQAACRGHSAALGAHVARAQCGERRGTREGFTAYEGRASSHTED